MKRKKEKQTKKKGREKMDSHFAFEFLYQHNYVPLVVNVLRFLMMMQIMTSSDDDNNNDAIESDHDGDRTDFGGWGVWSVYECISACRQSLKMDCLVNDRARFT